MLGISMRVMRHVYPGGTVEERDALAQDWPRFLRQVFPHRPVCYLPNLGAEISGFVAGLDICGLIFSGGEDWGLAPTRDATEAALFTWAMEFRLPVFGVCRGAQVINLLMGGKAEACENHIATKHLVNLSKPVAKGGSREVNSFHAHAIRPEGLAPGLKAFAVANDGTVEGFANKDGRIVGVMWHPERKTQPDTLDTELLHSWLPAS